MNAPHLDIDLVYHVDDMAFDLISRPDPRIQPAAAWIAEQFGLYKFHASIAVVDDQTIQELNAQRLGHDWPTDVISFVLDETERAVEGEVIASAETAARLCIAAGWTVDDELLLYVVHGLLHVAGLDDVTGQQRQAMRLMERTCLLALGVTAAENHVERFDTIINSEFEQ